MTEETLDLTEIVKKIKEVSDTLTSIDAKRADKIKELEAKHAASIAAVNDQADLEKKVPTFKLDVLKEKLKAKHLELLENVDNIKRDAFPFQSGNIIVKSIISNPEPTFKWTAPGTRLCVAQLKKFGTATSKYIKIEEAINWADLKKQCTIDKKTGKVTYSDSTNKILFELEGIQSTPVPQQHEIVIEEVLPGVDLSSSDIVDVI